MNDISDDDDKNSENSSIPPTMGGRLRGRGSESVQLFFVCFTTCFLLLFIIKSGKDKRQKREESLKVSCKSHSARYVSLPDIYTTYS